MVVPHVIRFRAARRAAVLVLAAACVAAPCLPASAAPAGTASGAAAGTVRLLTGQAVPLDPTRRTAAQETAYRDQISLLDAQGRLTPSAMAGMGLHLLTPPSSAAPARRVAPAPPARTAGRARPAGCSVVNPQASADAIMLRAPTIMVNYSSQGYIM